MCILVYFVINEPIKLGSTVAYERQNSFTAIKIMPIYFTFFLMKLDKVKFEGLLWKVAERNLKYINACFEIPGRYLI